jgi:chromosome segregation ATPase
LKVKEELLKECRREGNEAKSEKIFLEKQLASLREQREKESEGKAGLIAGLKEKAEELRLKYDEKMGEVNSLAGLTETLKEEKHLLECLNKELKDKQVRYGQEISRYLDNVRRRRD